MRSAALEAFERSGAHDGLPSAGARWHVGLTKPKRELYAAWNASRQGYAVFVPRYRQSRRKRDGRTITLVKPLFPRCIFIAFVPGVESWWPLRSTFGMTGLIMAGETPRLVPEGVVEGLSAASSDDGAFDPSRFVAAGGAAKVLSGPFADRIVRLVELSDAERARVLIEILGSEREVEVPVRALAPAGL